jgi:hypothetical protein
MWFCTRNKESTHIHTQHNDSESEFESSVMQLHVILHPTTLSHCGPHTIPFRPHQKLGFKGSLSPNTWVFHTTPFLWSPLQFHPLYSSISHQSVFIYSLSCLWYTAALFSSCYRLILWPNCLEFNYFFVC